MAARQYQDRTNLREQLLIATVKDARKHIPSFGQPHYRALSEVRSLDDLCAVPLLTKKQITDSPESFRNPRLKTALLQHTSGTSGHMLFVQRSYEELKAISDFFPISQP